MLLQSYPFYAQLISGVLVQIEFHFTGKNGDLVVSFVSKGGLTIYRHLILEGVSFDKFDERKNFLTYQSNEFVLGVPFQVSLVFKRGSKDMATFRSAASRFVIFSIFNCVFLDRLVMQHSSIELFQVFFYFIYDGRVTLQPHVY